MTIIRGILTSIIIIITYPFTIILGIFRLIKNKDNIQNYKYIVEHMQHDGTYVVGVFDTLEQAECSLRNCMWRVTISQIPANKLWQVPKIVRTYNIDE